MIKLNKNIEEMTPIEKANLLEGLTAKTENVEYSSQVAWLGASDDVKTEIKGVVENTRNLFGTGRINSLDYDQREAAIRNYHNRLDAYLSMYPEYAEKEEVQARHR